MQSAIKSLMEDIVMENSENWRMRTYIWMSLLVWFCANALSQAAFMGKWGTPYGRELLDAELGAWYWAMIALELLFYAAGIMFVTSRAGLSRTRGEQRSNQQSI